MTNLLVGIAQLSVRDNISENLKRIAAATEELSQKGAKIIVFPEYSTYNADDGFKEIAQDIDGEIISTFKKLAMEYNVYIHIGSFAKKIPDDAKVYNTALFINPEGEVEASYDKIHLFDVDLKDGGKHYESDEFESGKEIVLLSNKIGDFGFTTCYDLRFPELFRALTLNGAKVIFLSAQFRLYSGKDHWETLIRARAIENQVYVVACCGFGSFPPNEIRTYGNSMVVDPWGTVIARASESECCFTAEIDLDYLQSVRTAIPSLENRIEIGDLSIKKEVC